MDNVMEVMSIPELLQFKDSYKDNASIAKIVDGYILVKEQEVAKEKARIDFVKAIDKMIVKLPHPEDVHNVYFAWGEVEVEDTSQEAEQVEVVLEVPVCDEDGKIITPAVTSIESRYPKVKMFKWNVELNKGFQPARASSGGTTSGTSKRAITVKRIWDDKAPEVVGNFRTAKEACTHIGLIVGTDSAMRVLTNRNPYLVAPYEGTDFTEAES